MEQFTQLPPELARAQAYVQRIYDRGENGLRADDPRAQAVLGAVNEYSDVDLLQVLSALYERAPDEIGLLVEDENTLLGAIARTIGFSIR